MVIAKIIAKILCSFKIVLRVPSREEETGIVPRGAQSTIGNIICIRVVYNIYRARERGLVAAQAVEGGERGVLVGRV